MSVRWMGEGFSLVRDEDDHVVVFADHGRGGLRLSADEARRMAAGLCVAAERVDERDTERDTERGFDAA